MDLRSIYDYTLRREYEGYEFLLQNAARMQNASAANLLRALAAEEEAHIKHVKALMAALEDATQEAPALDLEAEGAFAQRTGAELLDAGVLASMMPDVAVLRLAYLIERDMADYYEAMARRLDGQARETFARLAEWERQHAELFGRLHDTLFREYTGLDWVE